jgi:large subunit ribosomal protein L21
MYAIVRDRGMQYRVEQGQMLRIDRLDAEPGSEIEFEEVLLIGGSEAIRVGTPLVSGASVRARVLGLFKGKKIVVFRYRRKKRFRRRTGHRQQYTRVQIQEILAG